MIKSMTGFGTAANETKAITVTVEVKSLNSKYLDTNIRLPRIFSEKEIELKNLIEQRLGRGKINLYIEIRKKIASQPKTSINRALVKSYYKDLYETATLLGASEQGIFKMALGMPEVMNINQKDNGTIKEWNIITRTVNEALKKWDEFRKNEGKQLHNKINDYVKRIHQLLNSVEKQDPKRKKTIKEKIRSHLLEITKDDNFDHNRFEQEMIYYIEKLDISEEKVRLKQHLDYFTKTLHSKDDSGKKLGFIAQEMGREMNTIGSKANDATIQRFVVEMKDELEKVREQLLNIL
ncbi:MAG: YicC family protein [Cytophagales bacterium]|nr:YicC family protein [Cytophagales bacterium]